MKIERKPANDNRTAVEPLDALVFLLDDEVRLNSMSRLAVERSAALEVRRQFAMQMGVAV